jgi:hypothetical protein
MAENGCDEPVMTPLIGLLRLNIPMNAFRSASVTAGNGSFAGRCGRGSNSLDAMLRGMFDKIWGVWSVDNIGGMGVLGGNGGGAITSGSTKLSSRSGSGQADTRVRN